MKYKWMKKFAAGAIAVILAAGTGGNVYAAAEASKNEVVYTRMDAQGKVRDIFVVNHFEISRPGEIVDYGNYSRVINMTNTETITQDGEKVSFAARPGDFYYQGTLKDTALPWNVEIAYYLDGTKVLPADLSGQEGALRIVIRTRKNPKISQAFYDNYMMQISLTVDSEKCRNIEAVDATIAEAGKDKIIAYTILPGKDADVTFTADIQDFEMSGIEIAGMPFVMNVELPNMDGMTGQFSQLSDAISKLHAGVGEFTDGVSQLKSGSMELTGGSADIRQGLAALAGNSQNLVNGSAQINYALTLIATSLSNGMAGGFDTSAMEQLPAALNQISGGLKALSAALTELGAGLAQSYAALDGAMQGLAGVGLSPDDLNALGAAVGESVAASGDPSLWVSYQRVVDYYTAAETLLGTYNYLQQQGAFTSVQPALDTMAASIGQIAATLDEISYQVGNSLASLSALQQLPQLVSGLSELAANYAGFQNGLVAYTDGVNQLASGYSEFHSGLSQFNNGVGTLANGANTLHNGTAALNSETAKLPEKVQKEIDELLAEYEGSNFEPVSFTSDKNKNIGIVQFVIKCDGIEGASTQKADTKEAESKSTFWDRLGALFNMGRK